MAFAWTVLFRDDWAVKKFRPASTPFVMSTKPLAFGVSIPSVRPARNVVNCHMYGYCSIRGIPLADLVHVLPFKSVSVEAQKALSKIEYLEGDSVTKVKEYDDVVRSLWEAKQLYEQFRWNYGELRRLVPCDQFDFLPDGFANGGFGERTVVNAAFGNYVSAARGLVDRMQAVMRKYDRGSNKELYKDYWKLPSSWYDEGGLYVFMYEIRNPVQHGQTVVSLVRENDATRVRFDLDQIVDMREYNTSPKLRAFLNKTISKIKDHDSSDCPYLCFRYTNMRYNELVIELFCHFLKCAEPRIRAARKDMQSLLLQHSKAVGKLGGSSFVAYVDGDMTHVYDEVDVDPVKQLKDMHRKAQKHLKDARNAIAAERRSIR